MPNGPWGSSSSSAAATASLTDIAPGGAQVAYTNLTHIGSLANATGWLKNDGSGNFTYTATVSGLGATLSAATPGATYTATEQAILQALNTKVRALETALKSFGIVAT